MKKLIAFAAGIVVGGVAVALAKDNSIREGDFIQWECQGKYMFSEPRRVQRIESSEFGTFYFVEGTATGIPMHQAIQQTNLNRIRHRVTEAVRRFPIDV